MKDLITELVGSGLADLTRHETGIYGMNCPIPVTVPASVLKLKPLSNEEIEAILIQEDLKEIDIA